MHSIDTLKEMLAKRIDWQENGVMGESLQAEIAALTEAISAMEWQRVTGREDLHNREEVVGLRLDGSYELIQVCHLSIRNRLSQDKITHYKRIAPPAPGGE